MTLNPWSSSQAYSTAGSRPTGAGSRWIQTNRVSHEIYLQTIDGSSRVKVAAGTRPRWSADGTELFFRRSGMLLAVAIETTDSGVKPGRAEPLFSGPYPLLPIDTYWAVHPDGQRFLMPRSESDLVDVGQEQITVILDWDQPVVEQ